MPSDTTPVWQIYNIPQPTYNQNDQAQLNQNQIQGRTQPIADLGKPADSKQSSGTIGDLSTRLGAMTGSKTLTDAGAAMTGISQGIAPSLISSGTLGSLAAEILPLLL